MNSSKKRIKIDADVTDRINFILNTHTHTLINNSITLRMQVMRVAVHTEAPQSAHRGRQRDPHHR